MSCVLERVKATPTPKPPMISLDESGLVSMGMNQLTVETEDSCASLLEFAANNDIDEFNKSIKRDSSSVDKVGLWYCRQKGSKQMVYEHRTPLMVAAMYGNIDVMKLILSLSDADVNFTCGLDKSTALHCAASGGAVNAVEVVKLLLEAGADVSSVDANGHRPVDVIVAPRRLPNIGATLEEVLMPEGFFLKQNLRISTVVSSTANSPPLSPSLGNGSPVIASDSPVKSKLNSAPEKKEYPIDPSLPDIRNSVFSTDEFRMYSFKVRPCSRAYSHDWTECPFVHPGENARRRDPRKFHYSCVPCPDFRKGSCRRGDMCEYAHGVFESWLHPAQYRTRLCKDGTSCERRVCFFAHAVEELRPLYASTGSGVLSPRSSADFAAGMSLLPGSPSSVSAMSPSPFTPPMSPSVANGISHSSVAWNQPNIPALNLPGSNIQSSRLRSSLNARDIPLEDYNSPADFNAERQQLLDELSSLNQQQPCLTSTPLNRSGLLKTLTPSNLDDLFSGADSSSPRYADELMTSSVFSRAHKSVVLNQFQQQSMLSPININFSKNADHHLLQASFASGRNSPRSMEPISPMNSQVSILAQREKQLQFRSLSSHELGSNSVASIVGSPLNSGSAHWGSANGKPDWTINANELHKLRRSNSFEFGNAEEPDLSWVQSLVIESPTSTKVNLAMPIPGTDSTSTSLSMNSQKEPLNDHTMGDWIQKLEIEQFMARQN